MGLLTDAYIVTGKEKILRKRKIVHYNGPSTITNNKLLLLLNTRQRIRKGHSKVANPEKLATQGTQDEAKQSKAQQNIPWTPLYANNHK